VHVAIKLPRARSLPSFLCLPNATCPPCERDPTEANWAERGQPAELSVKGTGGATVRVSLAVMEWKRAATGGRLDIIVLPTKHEDFLHCVCATSVGQQRKEKKMNAATHALAGRLGSSAVRPRRTVIDLVL
jgi:hypothetical protein